MKLLDKCIRCEQGVLRCQQTRRFGRFRKRYLVCDCCGERDYEVLLIEETRIATISTQSICPCCGYKMNDDIPTTKERNYGDDVIGPAPKT